MKSIKRALPLVIAIGIMSCNSVTKEEFMETIVAPVAKQVKKELTMHGHTRVDNYYWLNDRENPEVINYLNNENEYTQFNLAHTKPLQEKLYKEIVGRIKQTDMSVPYFENGFYYYSRNEEGKEYPIHCRKKGTLEADEEIMLDVNKMARNYAYYSVVGLSVSPDNKILAFGVDNLSRRLYTIYFKNLETGEIQKKKIKNTSGGATWANDSRTVFYSQKDPETLRVDKIFKHKLDEKTKDELIFHEADETFGTFVYRTKSDKYIVIGSYSTLSTEYRFVDADQPDYKFEIIQAREKDHEYSISHYKDHFYITTNHKAKNFRLMKTPVNKTGIENWTEVIPHRADVLLEEVEIFNDFFVLEERKNGLTEIRVKSWNGSKDYYIEHGEEVYTSYVSYNPDINTKTLRYGYNSMTTPNSVIDFNMDSKEKTLLKQQEVVGDFKQEDYKSERRFAKAIDGTEIPMSIVYKKGTDLTGKAPLLLYGYGSYGASMDPYFSSVRLSLLDRGFIYVIAHIRGGEEMGRQWYENGKLLKKKNTFTDFIACAEYLINEKYTSKDNLCAMGGSAGGLLMGAVVNLRPDIFNAVIAAVPFVDVVTTMLDESIPLTTGEYDEWGNPNMEDYYNYILSYSPYDNVDSVSYPAMLVTTGLHDSQVQYWEPAKWVAKLRDYKTDDNLLLLHTNMKAGHGGSSGRFERHKETAMEYAFLLDQVGITQ